MHQLSDLWLHPNSHSLFSNPVSACSIVLFHSDHDMDNPFVLDQGAYSLKAGWSSDDSPKIIPNCVAKVKSERRRLFVGDQLDECKDYSGLFYILPSFKGYIVNWDTQRQVWNYLFNNKFAIRDSADRSILLTEPYFNFRSIQENLLETFFEEYGFSSLSLQNPATLSAYKHNHQRDSKSLCALVVDCGYSFTHIVPFIEGKQVASGIRRIAVGGKALTNHLKDRISYMQLNVLDETYVMNQCKEDCCYVSTDFLKELDEFQSDSSSIVRHYVLPDYTHLKRGYVLKEGETCPTDCQKVRMSNERIQIPEMLFYPSDVGINQIGLSHAIYHSIESQPEEVRPHLYSNIILTGGSALFPGFRMRVYNDIRSLADVSYDVNVILPEQPALESWTGGQLLTRDRESFESMSATRKLYEESGPHACLELMDQT